MCKLANWIKTHYLSLFVLVDDQKTRSRTKRIQLGRGQVLDSKPVTESMLLPRHRLAKPPVPWAKCYACRPKHPACWFLSPYEFCQDFAVHRIRIPEEGYAGSLWTKETEKKDEPLIPGKHYILTEWVLNERNGILIFPSGSVLWNEIPEWYNTFRHSCILVTRSVRVVPCVVGRVPANRDTKQRRAFIFSIYLRPWTWSHKLADASVKRVNALDLAPSMVRNSWKK